MRHLIRGTATMVVLAGLVAAGCAADPATADQAADQAADEVLEAEHRERAEEAYNAYIEALRAGDAERAADIFADDVWLSGTGAGFESVRGRAEYLQRLESFLSQASVESMDVEIEDVIVLGDHVFELGTFSETFRIDEETISTEGRYSALWRVQDGEWRIVRYMWNERS